MQRRGHRDPVSPELAFQVLHRDRDEALKRQIVTRMYRGETATILGCAAAFLAPNTSGPCWGRLTLDHIKSEQRMGRRAESDPAHLVSLCEGHTENGARAGRQWNTAHRPLLRWYLQTLVIQP